MSSSDPPGPTGAGSKSPVSAGTSLCGVKRPPFSPPSREPRNWTESAMISTDWRLLPCLSSHSPLEPPVDGHGPALGEILGAVLALGAPDGDVEEVGLVHPV